MTDGNRNVKKNKRKLRTPVLIVLVLILGAVAFLIINALGKDDNSGIGVNEGMQFDVNTEVFASSLLSSEWKDKMDCADFYLDLSSVGEKSVTIPVGGKKIDVSYKVVDTVCPEITFVSDVAVVRFGETFDPASQIASVTDNSGEKISATYEGDVDLTKPGNYIVFYKATDSSGNLREKSLTVVVESNFYEIKNGEYKLIDGIYTTSNGKKLIIEKGIAYVAESLDADEKYIIANKTFPVPKDYNPGFVKVASDAYQKMYDAAYNETKSTSHPIKLTKRTAFRDYYWQNSLYTSYVRESGKEAADTFSARPGFSEHETGYCLDMVSVTSSKNAQFKAEYDWLSNNAWKFGYILRYPEGPTDITGYIYEPWHYRYVGKELAEKLWNNGNWITMEEYFGIDSSYKY